MLTVERSGKTTIVTILDNTGNDAELEVSYDDGGMLMFLRQEIDNEEPNVITLTPVQADVLLQVLRSAVMEEPLV